MENKPFLYFDLGGVLFDFQGGIEEIAKITGSSFATCHSTWREFDDQICRGEMTGQQLWTIYSQRTNYSGPDILFNQFWVEHFRPNNQMHEFLVETAYKYPVGLLTNIYPDVYPLAISHGKIPNVNFRAVIQSCEIGSVKPESEIYRVAEIQARTNPDRILLIDDSEKNISTAIARGWHGIFFDRNSIHNSIMHSREILEGLF